MKKSLTYLPQNKREELKTIVGYVLEEPSNCEMIIRYDKFGIRMYIMSDYDLMADLLAAKLTVIN